MGLPRVIVIADEGYTIPAMAWADLARKHQVDIQVMHSPQQGQPVFPVFPVDEKMVVMNGRQQGKSRFNEMMAAFMSEAPVVMSEQRQGKQKAQWKQDRGTFRKWGK